MKKILICLAILAVYAAANTCTETVFKYIKGSLLPNSKEAYHDSSYFLENYGHKNEWSHKLYYTKGKIDSLVMDPMEEGDSLHVSYFYWNIDESALKGNTSEYIITQEVSGDTIIFTEKHYSKDTLDGVHITKITGSYISSRAYEYDSFEEIFFSNDTLYDKRLFDYSKDTPRPGTLFTVGDPSNDFKCYEYETRDGETDLRETIEYIKTDKGFKLKYLEESSAGYYLREFFMVNPEGSSTIRKRRPAVKISPKARYFDLLGRYKFTK
jgi:hypothetical protein